MTMNGAILLRRDGVNGGRSLIDDGFQAGARDLAWLRAAQLVTLSPITVNERSREMIPFRAMTLLGRRALTAALLAAGWVAPAGAATVIRDAEIEATIHRIADPIFATARLDRDSIDLYVINDDKLNAFVAGGQNLFLNTGLIVRTETPDQLAGVIAHETGHIAGGHLSRSLEARSSAGTSTLLGALLGAAAAVAGAPQLGTALLAGGLTVGQSNFLKFSRNQEQAADQAAVSYLRALKMSPEGLLEFFEILDSQNLRLNSGGNPYMRTHPLTRDRITVLEREVETSPFRAARPSPDLVAAHARAVAKLDGFLSPPAQVLQRRRGDGLADRYARAIAHYRVPDLDRALELVDGLIREHPEDPYFPELKGQMLFENGRIAESVPPYRQAVRNRPDSALLRLGLARALIEQGQASDLDEAAALLQEVVRIEPVNAGAWRFLGIAEGRRGREGPAAVALAEQAVLLGNREDAELYIRRAQQQVRPDDPSWYRLQDLERATEDLEPEDRRRR
jgi:predicted Zn-dependent protease